MDYFNRKYIFQPLIFRGYVSFRGVFETTTQTEFPAMWVYLLRRLDRCLVPTHDFFGPAVLPSKSSTRRSQPHFCRRHKKTKKQKTGLGHKTPTCPKQKNPKKNTPIFFCTEPKKRQFHNYGYSRLSWIFHKDPDPFARIGLMVSIPFPE